MNILTFDIEEWFHTQFDPNLNIESEWSKYESRIEKNMDMIFQLLEQHNQKATFFCLGWIARKYPNIIKQIDRYGHEIGSHSDMHKLAYLQNRQEYKSDFVTAINSLEDLIGKKVKSYRSPAFSIKKENKWAFEIIIENGIEIDCSIFPSNRDYGGFDGFTEDKPCIINFEEHSIKEFPMNSFSMLNKSFIFSGGGYFRFFPYWAIKKMMQKSEYVMTYFHPRDFDAGQPMIKELPLHRKFKSYYGLDKSYEKLENLLEEFKFMDLKTAELKIDWTKVNTIKIA
jgi:peptidoglycan-N-acetylglucosamine deacetylase